MRVQTLLSILAALKVLLSAAGAPGQVPQLINYQGQLANADGKPLNGTFTLKFEIFDSPSGGSALWNETQTVTITNGGFHVLLGSAASIPLNLFDADASTYLQMSVDGTALSPRQQFGSVPYALTARATGWTISGNNIYRSSGKVGIGTPNPRDPLGIRAQGIQQGLISFEDPNGVTKWHLEQNFGGNTPGLNFVETGVADFRLMIRAGGNVGIGTGNPNFRLDVRGTIGSNTTLYHSDARWKKNIQPLSQALDQTSRLRGVSYEWRVDEFKAMNFPPGKKIGLIAQEVEQVIPEVVSTDKEGFKSVEYAKLTALLIEAVKELRAENEALKKRIEVLEKGLSAKLKANSATPNVIPKESF